MFKYIVEKMDVTKWLVVFGFCLILEISDGKRCYSNRRGFYYRCDSTEKCCSSESYPCCDADTLSTGVIIGVVIAIIVFIIIIALVVYLVYRANKRKRSIVTTTTVGRPTVQTFQTTTYTQGYGMTPGQGQMYPPPPQPQPPPYSDPVYPPPPPTYTG